MSGLPLKSTWLRLLLACGALVCLDVSASLDQSDNRSQSRSVTIQPSKKPRIRYRREVFTPERALQNAAAQGYITKLKNYISAGVDLNSEGGAALRYAVEKEQYDAALLLIRSGANVNLSNAQTGWTALHAASSIGNARLIRLLLQAGANPKRRDQFGRTPADVAKTPETRALFQSND